MYSKVLVGLTLGAVLTGCPGTFNGTVSGSSLAVADTIFYASKDAAGKTTSLVALMADKGGVCGTLKANREPKSSTFMMLQAFRLADDNTILAPDVGEYTVLSGSPTKGGNYAWATFFHYDANCTNTLTENARTGKSGVVKLTTVNLATNGSAAGSFDITFGSDHVTGSISASYCDMSAWPTSPSCE
jgi:hypothetical protein